MRLQFKHIAFLVVISLICIFAYQAYWLTGLYHIMHGEMKKDIIEAMRMSDYNEMMIRVEKMRKDSTLSTDRQTNKTEVSSDSVQACQTEETANSSSSPQAALRAKGGLDMILRDQNSMLELAVYLQRGLHSGLDIISAPDVVLYDSLLTSFLHSRNINLPHKLLHLHKGSRWDSTVIYTDTLATLSTPGYVPTPKAIEYDYSFDLHANQSYRLIMEPVCMQVLKQMSGILATSSIILIILSLSFWFLIRTILQQKTLEEMKSDFTNNVTHELKTPIAVAYAANDALLNFDQAKEKVQRDKYLHICQEQLQRLSELVEQILSMSMERRKTFRLHPEILTVRKILEPLVEQHKLKAAPPAHITIEIEPEDLTVFADRTHFTNIISNLIDNAVKYSHGEAEINIRCRKATDKEQKEQTEISVSDHGIGIAPEKQKHIFDKFYRIPTGNLHDVKGYGLGLFYVKTMTAKHGGSISVKSEPGKGSIFTIRI
ncbi:sensor histidine kinase [Bacteroides sp. KG68]|uniref:sensor histidine kinase n=1 Tax=unclassified Bacteroides TaxID=2646097 RepID=UPI003D97BF3C